MVYMFLIDGFEETEAILPLDILRRAGIDVTTVGISGREVTGSHGITVIADVTAPVGTSDAKMLILPGGPGTTKLQESEWLHEQLTAAYNANIYIAAICAAPSVLGGMGMLSGKRATCYPGYEAMLSGAEVVTNSVVCDGNIITAKGAGTAAEFGFALTKLLAGEECADNIADAMQFGK